MLAGPEDYHARIDDPDLAIDDGCILLIRDTGPLGCPGAAEVVTMQPPAALIKQGTHALPCIGDGRHSGTSGSPSILNASPEAALGGGLAVLRTGDRVRIDLPAREVNVLLSDENSPTASGISPRRGVSRCRPRRHRGRRSGGPWSTSSTREWC